jgi:hypothetical protein
MIHDVTVYATPNKEEKELIHAITWVNLKNIVSGWQSGLGG